MDKLLAMPPFQIAAAETRIQADPALFRARFAADAALRFDGVIAPDLLERLLASAAAADFVENPVLGLGQREIEAAQRVGASINLLLGRHAWLDWLEQATGLAPLRATAGRLVQTRANGTDGLTWHDDMDQQQRMLGLVVNLSGQSFDGGLFEMRHTGQNPPFHSVRHDRVGSILVFAVNPAIEHRVMPVTAGGPRRVFAGWVLALPEHADDPLARRKAGL
jgi:hypothetical protein